MNIGKRIISLRENKGWNQRELANRVGLNPSVMNRIELEDRPIKDNELIKLANVLDCSTDYLLGRTDSKNQNSKESNSEFETWMNDPRSKILFKEFNESSEEQKEALLKMWEILKSQGKL